MVRRRSSEIIHSGEAVNPTEKLGSAAAASARIRKKPKVIEATASSSASASAGSDLASLEAELGMTRTARAGERGGPSLSAPVQSRKREPDANWRENKHDGKKRADPDWKEGETGTKPTGDIAPPLPDQPKAGPQHAPPPAASAPAPAPAQKPAPAPEAPAANKPPPAAGVAKPKKVKPATPRELSKQNARSAVSAMVDQLKSRAHANGGFLRAEDITAMEAGFHEQVAQITKSMEQSFEAFVEARERAEWDSARAFPFGRIMVKRFSHLFKEPHEGRMDGVSKRILPGFFSGLNMMIGPESIDLFQERTRRVVEQIRDGEGEDFDWDSVYAARDTSAIVIDALMSIAPHFENFDRRRDWFIELVNANLSRVGEHDPDSGWELSPAGYKRFLAALYADVGKLLATGEARERIVKRYGANAVDAAENIIVRTGA